MDVRRVEDKAARQRMLSILLPIFGGLGWA